MNRIVSRDVKVERLSNMRNESMSGLRKPWMVSGKVCVSWFTDLISRYLYSLVVAA